MVAHGLEGDLLAVGWALPGAAAMATVDLYRWESSHVEAVMDTMQHILLHIGVLRIWPWR